MSSENNTKYVQHVSINILEKFKPRKKKITDERFSCLENLEKYIHAIYSK